MADTCQKMAYIVREDGAKRMITREERDAAVPYEILLATESGMAAPKPTSRRGLAMLYLLIGAVVPLLLIWGMYRRARSVVAPTSVPTSRPDGAVGPAS